MEVRTVKLYFGVLITLVLAGCAELNVGWYKPGFTQQEFAQDKFACMNGSQMQVSASNVNGTGSTYNGASNTTCNSYGSTTNCSSAGGYSQPGNVSGSSASYTTTNQPLFQACMQARGYMWTNQAAVAKYEAGQQEQRNAEAQAEKDREDAKSLARQRAQSAAGAAAAEAAGISRERYRAAQARCRAVSLGDDSVCNELNANDVVRSEAVAAAKQKLANDRTPQEVMSR
jgi:hypothetical protein